MKQRRRMNLEGISERLFKTLTPQLTIAQVIFNVRCDVTEVPAMLYARSITDELGNWKPLPYFPLNHESQLVLPDED